MIFKFISDRATMPRCSRVLFALVLLACLSAIALAQEPGIQDNSFLMEEAYNQEASVVQEISSFTWSAVSHSWVYSFTNEWPVNGIQHQFSFTVLQAHTGGFGGSFAGFGDTAINYRYQLKGSGDTRVAISPRISLLVPSGNPRYGRGFGGTGLQTNLPFSVVLSPKLVTHLNAGATWIPHGKNDLGDHAGLTGYNLGQSFIWQPASRFNAMLETVYTNMETVAAPGKTIRQKALLMSPGVRWAYNFKSGLQIVPGIAVPLGVGPSSGDKGVLVYLSFEQPLKMLNWQRKKSD